MKKIIYVIFLACLILIISQNSLADNEFSKEIKDFETVVDKYNTEDINLSVDDGEDYASVTEKLKSYLIRTLNSEFERSIYILIIITMICITVSVINNFISENPIQEAACFGCYAIAAYLTVINFKNVFDYCADALINVCDFMDITIPTFLTVLASSGYSGTAISIQGVFLIMSSFISHIVKNTVMPIMFVVGILGIVNGMSYGGRLRKLIKLVSKTAKYSIGLILTIFAGILSFSGLSSSSVDSLTLKTAKYAVSSFVPIVGNCLSDALGTVVSSSVVLKNQIGFICFIILIIICLIPIIKTAVIIFVFKFCSSVSQIISNDRISLMIDSVSECLVTICCMLLFVSVIFVIVIGIIASIGG